jgi:hypothetical protein
MIILEGKWMGRFYLAWKLFEATGRMLANGTVEIEIRAASETSNVMYTAKLAVYSGGCVLICTFKTPTSGWFIGLHTASLYKYLSIKIQRNTAYVRESTASKPAFPRAPPF